MQTAGEPHVFPETDALSSMFPSGAHGDPLTKINRHVGGLHSGPWDVIIELSSNMRSKGQKFKTDRSRVIISQ